MLLAVVGVMLCQLSGAQQHISVERLADRPIISPDLHSSIGTNIQGPSMIRVPDWVE